MLRETSASERPGNLVVVHATKWRNIEVFCNLEKREKAGQIQN